MTAQIAESVSGMAVIQAFNRERAFLAEFDRRTTRTGATNTHAQYLNSLFFPGIELLGVDRDGRPCSGSAASCSAHGLADDRDARLLGVPAQPRLPAAAGALRPLRAGAVGGRGDGEDQHRPRRRAGDPRRAGRRRLRRASKATCTSTGSRSRTARDPVLHAIDIHVPAGGCLALVGESGGGKSTTAKLVGPLLRPRRGRDPRRRRRPARARAARVPAPARRRAPGPVPLRRHDRRQHPLRAARGDRRAGRRRRTRRRRRPHRAPLRARACCTRCARAAPASRPVSAS